MNHARTRLTAREIVGDAGSITAELRKPAPNYDFIVKYAQAIAQAALDIESKATAESKRQKEMREAFAEIMPQLLGEKAGN